MYRTPIRVAYNAGRTNKREKKEGLFHFIRTEQLGAGVDLNGFAPKYCMSEITFLHLRTVLNSPALTSESHYTQCTHTSCSYELSFRKFHRPNNEKLKSPDPLLGPLSPLPHSPTVSLSLCVWHSGSLLFCVASTLCEARGL